MKTKILLRLKAAAVLSMLLFVIVVGVAMTYRDTRDYIIDGFIDSVRLKIKSPTVQSSNAVEIVRGSTLELAIPGSNTVAGLKVNLGIQTGAVVLQTASTSATFTATYSAPPTVLITQDLGSPTNVFVSSVTTSNFTLNRTGTTSNYVRWASIGAP